MISVVINVRNGMPTLENALRSVHSWAGEIVVVDMQSTDGSREASLAAGARVFDTENIGYVEPARAFAVAQARGAWILILDADEMVPKPLSERLIAISRSGTADVVSVARENWIFGSPLHHSGWQPDVDRHYRFFKQGALTFSNEIHSVPTPVHGSRVLHLPFEPGVAISHFNYATVQEFVDRMNRYTSIEAATLDGLRTPTIRRDGFLAGSQEIYRRYLRGGGLRGDWRGSVLTALMGIYRLLVILKAQEIRHQRGRDTNAAVTAEMQRLLQEYDGDSPSRGQ